MNDDLLILAMQNILHEIEEGIHIVNHEGVTLVYNDAMEKIEGLDSKNVLGKHILDIFPNWTIDNSTLLSALERQKPIYKQLQNYVNFKGKKIHTVNTTFPIFKGDIIIGAVEIAKNFTEVSNMSEQIIELQSKLLKPKKVNNGGVVYYSFDNLLGKNKKFLEAVKIAKRAALSSSSVIIEGETGTGKELFAQSIHSASNRADKPFVAQNCAALPETLLEGILFGTTKGSFTDAQDRPGLFEQANGGTLFLDEFNSMSLTLQAKLLRVLQESYVRRIGGQKDIPVDVRIIAATNDQLIELVEQGLIRRDLYYRLNVLNVKIPPLRDRIEDISILTESFIRTFNGKLNKDVWMISNEVTDLFRDYNWPGNIRELQNLIETAMNMINDEHVILKEHLPSHVEALMDQRKSSQMDLTIKEVDGLNEYLEEIERKLIENYLKENKYNISKTSQALKISRQNLQYKIKKFKIEMV